MTDHASPVDPPYAAHRGADSSSAPTVSGVHGDTRPPLAHPVALEAVHSPAAPLAAPQPNSAAPSGPAASFAELGFDPENLWHESLRQIPSWLTSTVVHLALVLGLALITSINAGFDPGVGIEVSAGGGGNEGVGTTDPLPGDAMALSSPLAQAAANDGESITDETIAVADALSSTEIVLPENTLDLKRLGGPGDSLGLQGTGGGFDGGDGSGSGGASGPGHGLSLRRDLLHRGEIVRRQGGTAESEAAVEMALAWLANHQNYDGSWSFEHQKSPKCHGQCENPGFKIGSNAATGLALLPFLGTGQTHQEGPYRKNIDAGLRFLLRSMQKQGDVASLYEPGGEMYGHGLASIALCEAYGMTHDPALAKAAQGVINYISAAQDPQGGGWRYMYQQPGDTSVMGWQLMALKSGQMAYLKVSPVTYRKAGYFLDHVQGQKGAVYGYQSPENMRPATTAIGLLSRMYMGWKRDQPALRHGVEMLSQLGPSTDTTSMRNNMYYNYYATQVMHHYGGYPWQQWNLVMREYLIKTQSRKGHEYGSWYFQGSDLGGPAGGRLYCTALSAMTLEVYYRYMPLYRPISHHDH